MTLLEELRFTADAYARNYPDHKHTPALLRTAAATIERLQPLPPGEGPSGIDTSTRRLVTLFNTHESIPTYIVNQLLRERDAWRENYWMRMDQMAKLSGDSSAPEKVSRNNSTGTNANVIVSPPLTWDPTVETPKPSNLRAVWHRANVVEVPDTHEMYDHYPGDTVSRYVAVSNGFVIGRARWHYPTKSWCHKDGYTHDILFWSLLPTWDSTADPSTPETSAPQPPSLTLEQSVFNADGSRDWYAPAWSTRTTIASKLYIPMELLAAALGFLKRARYFTPEGSGELTDEINAYLSTFGIERAGHTPQCSSQETKPDCRPLTAAEAAVIEEFGDELTTIYPCKCGSMPGTSIRGQMYCTNCGEYRADKSQVNGKAQP